VTKKELERILKKNGWIIIHGAKHDAAVKDGTGTKIPIPRHKGDLDNRTVKTILKEAGIE
jgi:predicted RNA binding protein YcfA (HicA-like mRNA interferase family)